MNANQPYYRSDAPLIRALSKQWGSQIGRQYSHLPLIQIQPPLIATVLHALHETPPAGFRVDTEIGREPLEQLVWLDAIFEMQDLLDVFNKTVIGGSDDGADGPVWIRIRRFVDWDSDPGPWQVPGDVIPEHPEQWLMLEYFPHFHGEPFNPQSSPELLLLPRNLWWDPQQARCVINRTVSEDRKEHLASLANPIGLSCALLLNYLRQAHEYLVEVQPPKPATVMKPAVLRDRPWLQARPHIILVDPSQVHKYRPSNKMEHEHAEKIRHGVRGHWVTYRHQRYAHDLMGKPIQRWRKPHWRGSLEWEFQGQRYKVIDKNFELGGQLEGRAKGDG